MRNMTIGITRAGPRRLRALSAALLAGGLAVAGCVATTQQHGYVLSESALDQIPVGSSREQVLIVLGTPSTTATIGGEIFYYISQKSQRGARFMRAKVTEQRVLAVYFDGEQRVERIADYGLQDGKVFDFVSRTTPTGGKDINFVTQVIEGLGRGISF